MDDDDVVSKVDVGSDCCHCVSWLCVLYSLVVSNLARHFSHCLYDSVMHCLTPALVVNCVCNNECDLDFVLLLFLCSLCGEGCKGKSQDQQNSDSLFHVFFSLYRIGYMVDYRENNGTEKAENWRNFIL